jgi:hypothetical protein
LRDGGGAAKKVRIMIYKLARALQFIGLTIPPVAIMGNVADERLSLKGSLILSGVGVLIFFIGWLLQQGTRPQ